MAALPAGSDRSGARGSGTGGPAAGPAPVRSVAADRSGAVRDRRRTIRSWPLLVLAVPAAAEVWSGWVGIAQKTGFGAGPPAAGHLVLAPPGHGHHPPGRRRVLRGLRAARLAGHRARDQRPDPPVRQVVRDLLLRARHGRAGRLPPDGPGRVTRAPWGITTLVSCLPVLVLGMGTALAHMLRDDADGHGARTRRSRGPAPRSVRGPGPRGPGPVRSGPGGRHERDRSAAPDQADVPLGSRRCRPGQAACSRDRKGRYRPGPPARREADRRGAARLAASPARGRRTRLQRGPERPRANGQR